MNLAASVTSLSGIGSNYAGKLTKLNISSLFDLLYHLPFRYEDRSLVSPVSTLSGGQTVTLIGTVTSIKNEYTKSGKFIQKAVFSDNSGSIEVVWFNQIYLVRALRLRQVALHGKVDFFAQKITLVSPEYELISHTHSADNQHHGLIHMARIVPVYPETAGISSKWLRHRIFSLLTVLPDTDPWPASGLPGWKESLTEVHFPSRSVPVLSASVYRRRLAYDELLLLQTKSLLLKKHWQSVHLAHPFEIRHSQVLDFISSLPFSLTSSQNQSIREILRDLSRSLPMNRLLEGDVGSGKTVVAAAAAYTAFLNGFQSVLLAPTQILASQHYHTLTALFRPYEIPVTLVTSAARISRLTSLNSQILVGTHALFSDKNQDLFRQVGLVIIDEQHRFGVLQRSMASKLGASPHVLTMTATPIPRSVALTMFGNLDLSVLTEKPAGRVPVKTWVVPETKRDSAYSWIKSRVREGASQAFIVCPFIEESESAVTVKAATAEYEKLKGIFRDFRLGLLHGRLKATEKTSVINAFRAGDYDILVTTPIVEVGIDIPDATLMVIEGAERFGLAQLHQMRGRVGRSNVKSFCLLFSSTGRIPRRLKALETVHSGIKLAELDLKYRGPGEIYGTAQHGFPDFKIASFDDLDLIQNAVSAARKILPSIKDYPVLRDLLKNDKITLIQPN